MFEWTVEREALQQALSDPFDRHDDVGESRRDGAPAVAARYHALVRNLPDAIVAVHDRDLRGVSIDGPALADAAGDARERFAGRTLRELLGDRYEALEPHYRAALDGHRSSTEFEGATSERVFAVEIVPLREHDEAPVDGVFTVARDITAQKRAEREARQRAEQQAAVAALGVAALKGMPTARLVEEAVGTVKRTLDADMSELLEPTADHEGFLLRAGVGWHDGLIGSGRAPIGAEYYPSYTCGVNDPVTVCDYATEKRFRPTPLLEAHGAAASISIAVGAKRPCPVLAVHSLSPREFRPDERDFMQAVANVIAEAMAREAAEEHMRHQALHDPLTGLPNRTLLLERIDRWLEAPGAGGKSAAVLFIDIDHFKVVNDALGHEAGDQLLKTVAKRLRSALRPRDTVGRVGGDEFVVLCEDIDADVEAVAAARRLSMALDEPFELGGHRHHVTASIGISTWEEGATADVLMRNADAAMYRAKERGRSRFELFDQGMRQWTESWLTVEAELRDALERDELVNVYQPIVDPADGRVVGFEALVRWNHPRRGVIAPMDFIPVAEQIGLIVPLGHEVLRAACEEAARWPARVDGMPLRISVNLSPRQLSDPGLVDSVAAVLKATRLAPDRLSLEITESAFTEDPARALDVLNRLKGLGVRLELDDFGSGYSSLTYVRMFPIDALKIDRSFVQGVCRSQEDAAIVAAVISMGRALGVHVVAEGVESAEQAELLQTLGCTLAQGYLFAQPLPAEALGALVAAS